MVQLTLNEPLGAWRATSAVMLDWWSPLVILTLVRQDGAYTQNVRLDLGKRALLDHPLPDVDREAIRGVAARVAEQVREGRAADHR